MHAPAGRVRARLVEALDSAGAAKQMFRLAAAKPVRGEVAPSLEQSETLMRDEEMKIAGRRTHRAVTIEHLGLTLA